MKILYDFIIKINNIKITILISFNFIFENLKIGYKITKGIKNSDKYAKRTVKVA